jgi:hypothetical protein
MFAGLAWTIVKTAEATATRMISAKMRVRTGIRQLAISALHTCVRLSSGRPIWRAHSAAQSERSPAGYPAARRIAEAARKETTMSPPTAGSSKGPLGTMRPVSDSMASSSYRERE